MTLLFSISQSFERKNSTLFELHISTDLYTILFFFLLYGRTFQCWFIVLICDFHALTKKSYLFVFFLLWLFCCYLFGIFLLDLNMNANEFEVFFMIISMTMLFVFVTEKTFHTHINSKITLTKVSWENSVYFLLCLAKSIYKLW